MNKKRIRNEVLTEFNEIMDNNFPDMRIGELITSIFKQKDLLYIEDTEFIEIVRQYVEHINSNEDIQEGQVVEESNDEVNE